MVGRTVGHFSYYESVAAALLDRGARVDLILDKDRSRKWAPGDRSLQAFMAGRKGFARGWLTRRSDRWREPLFGLRELRTYRSYLVREQTTAFYVARWRGYLGPRAKALSGHGWFRAMLRTALADAALRLTEIAAPADRAITEFLKKKQPDLVFASPLNMRFAEETDYVKAAVALGIPTAALVQTWDSLTTKGLFQVLPDRLFVWNAEQAADAEAIHRFPRDCIEIAGAPFFDKWFAEPGDLPDRAAFCRMAGLDPARPILLYLGSSRNIAGDETWLVEELLQRLAAAAPAVQVLVRPHPANAAIYAPLADRGVAVWPRGGALPETADDFAGMRASFSHAAAAVGINTSGMIDAVLADVPTFTVKLPQYAATQAEAAHFRYLERASAMYLAEDLEDLTGGLTAVLDGRDPKTADRRAFAGRFARPRGLERSAGDVIAEQLIAMATQGRAKRG